MHLRLLALFAIAACGRPPGPVAPEPHPLVAADARASEVDRILAGMSVRERAAQLVIPWVPGTYAADDDPALERALHTVASLGVGGVIVSAGSPLDIAAKLNRLQRAARLPLLVAADLESGTYLRLLGGTAFPTNMGVAAGGRDSDAYEMGRVTAREGRAVGIHLALAPVADVNNNPANPIINTRSFGEDPHVVARMVAATVRGMQDHGLLATAKHFPGHGDTDTDSHLALAVVGADWRRLDSLELVPFRAAIEAGVAAVMSAHVAVPGVDGDAGRPGTVAPAVLTGLLRDSLRFQGLVVTDALNMGGLVHTYGAAEAPVLALLAGADLLLQPADAGATIDAIVAAVADGRLSEERLDRSVRRVLALKEKLGLFANRTVPLDAIPRIVGSAEHLQAARAAAQRSIVLLRDRLGTVDSVRARPRRIAMVAYAEENTAGGGDALAAALRAAGDTVTMFRLHPASGPASYDSARATLASGTVALFSAAVRATPWRGRIALPAPLAQLINEVAARHPTILVSLGSPYLLTQTPNVDAYLIAWAATRVSEEAAAAALTGAAITGRLPIRIPPFYAFGAGLQRPETPRRGHHSGSHP